MQIPFFWVPLLKKCLFPPGLISVHFSKVAGFSCMGSFQGFLFHVIYFQVFFFLQTFDNSCPSVHNHGAISFDFDAEECVSCCGSLTFFFYIWKHYHRYFDWNCMALGNMYILMISVLTMHVAGFSMFRCFLFSNTL